MPTLNYLLTIATIGDDAEPLTRTCADVNELDRFINTYMCDEIEDFIEGAKKQPDFEARQAEFQQKLRKSMAKLYTGLANLDTEHEFGFTFYGDVYGVCAFDPAQYPQTSTVADEHRANPKPECSPAYNAGWAAFLEGRSIDECPYENSPSRKLEFLAGWREAEFLGVRA